MEKSDIILTHFLNKCGEIMAKNNKSPKDLILDEAINLFNVVIEIQEGRKIVDTNEAREIIKNIPKDIRDKAKEYCLALLEKTGDEKKDRLSQIGIANVLAIYCSEPLLPMERF